MNTPLTGFTRYFALGVGVAFLLAGGAGFLPFFIASPRPTAPDLVVNAGYGLLLGLFPVNIIHNLFHLGVGLLGLLAFRTYSAALLFAQCLGITLAVFTLMGLVPAFRTGFGILPLYGHDIWLHGLEAIVGIYLGFFAARKTPVVAEKSV